MSPGRYRHKSVIDLSPRPDELDPMKVAIDLSYVELIVRAALGDEVHLDRLPASAHRAPAPTSQYSSSNRSTIASRTAACNAPARPPTPRRTNGNAVEHWLDDWHPTILGT